MSDVSAASTYPPEQLVAYDSDWVARFEQLASDLRAALGAASVVEHIGSTSVPGLVAKPVIDLAVQLPPGERLDDHITVWGELGWSGPHDLGTHRCLFLLEQNVRHAIAHLFTAEQWQSAHQRLFAAWLRGHDDDRDAYALLKRTLVASGVWGQAYTSAKTEFVEAIVDRARAAQGLDPAPVWDAAATDLVARSRRLRGQT
ncbi:MAG: GrpB family protein [Humibacillus sp.]|nr:GrpB family protein [Humibacillus sp.]MDN5778113.1 GrpB family protein [Humibacillus sp.]